MNDQASEVVDAEQFTRSMRGLQLLGSNGDMVFPKEIVLMSCRRVGLMADACNLRCAMIAMIMAIR
jgi:hypothetical protein